MQEPSLLDYLTFSIMLGTCLTKLHSFPTKPCKLKQLQGLSKLPPASVPLQAAHALPQVICQVAPKSAILTGYYASRHWKLQLGKTVINADGEIKTNRGKTGHEENIKYFTCYHIENKNWEL